MINIEDFSLKCDEQEIKGKFILPENPKAIIQFNNGTATPCRVYQPYLEYLASHNFASVLWDYRGSGASAPDDMSKCDYKYSDYGTKDMPAIKSYIDHKFPKLPKLLIGHSAGGQQVGFMHNNHDFKGMIAIAVSTGYAPFMPLNFRIKSNYFFYIFTPLSIRFNGFLNAKKYKIMENLPKNVVLEWRAWCSKEHYLFDEAFYGKTIPKGNFQELPFPIQVYYAADDTISSVKNVKNFWKHIKSTKAIDFTKFEPKDLDVDKIDHFGYFKKRMKNTFWEMTRLKLEAFLNL